MDKEILTKIDDSVFIDIQCAIMDYNSGILKYNEKYFKENNKDDYLEILELV